MNIVCKNCATHYKGNFCPHCSQKSSLGRLNVSNVLGEFWHNLTHTDHSVFGLIKQMFLNPGLVIREFIEGKRKKYFNPYTFFLVVTGLLIFVSSQLFQYEDSLYQVRNEFGQYVSKHYNLIIICCIPFIAFVFKLLFVKYKYNYAEWITFFIFSFGFINFLQIFIHLLFFAFIKYHFQLNGYAQLLGYFIFAYILFSFLRPKKIMNIVGCILATIFVYWAIEKVGSSVTLWLWGMPFKDAIKGINLF